MSGADVPESLRRRGIVRATDNIPDGEELKARYLRFPEPEKRQLRPGTDAKPRHYLRNPLRAR